MIRNSKAHSTGFNYKKGDKVLPMGVSTQTSIRKIVGFVSNHGEKIYIVFKTSQKKHELQCREGKKSSVSVPLP